MHLLKCEKIEMLQVKQVNLCEFWKNDKYSECNAKNIFYFTTLSFQRE